MGTITPGEEEVHHEVEVEEVGPIMPITITEQLMNNNWNGNAPGQ